MRKVLTILLPLILVLTACGPSEGKSAGAAEILDSVKVSGGTDKEAPTVEFESPLEITGVAAKTITEGKGATIEEGQQLTFHAVFLNAEDGSALGDTYTAGEPQPLVLNEEFKTGDAELYDVLVGSKVGSQVAYTRPQDAVEGQPAPTQQVIVLRVLSAEAPAPEPEILSPEAVQELEDKGELPTFTVDDKGAPEISLPENDPTSDLAVKVLKEGDGEVVEETDTITANYSGWRWEDGENFDSSYSRGEPAEFPLTGVIQGWTKGLAGQKVGSTVMLVIPAPWAYGDPATQGRPSGTLVFYVEIVKRTPAE